MKCFVWNSMFLLYKQRDWVSRFFLLSNFFCKIPSFNSVNQKRNRTKWERNIFIYGMQKCTCTCNALKKKKCVYLQKKNMKEFTKQWIIVVARVCIDKKGRLAVWQTVKWIGVIGGRAKTIIICNHRRWYIDWASCLIRQCRPKIKQRQREKKEREREKC